MDGHVPHALVGAVRQRHGRSHRDGIARVDAHGVHVLNGTDDDDVVVPVPKKLQFEFFPPQQGLVNKHLVDGARLQTALERVVKLVFGEHKRRTGTAQRERRPNAQRKTVLLRNLLAFEVAVRRLRRRHRNTDLEHELLELLPVFRNVDGVDVHPNDVNAVLFPQTLAVCLNAQIQGRLAAHGGKHRINLALFENVLQGLHRQRQQVHVVRNHGVRHDGGRIGVDQGNLNALFAQRPCGLRTGVIKFTRLANHNGATANDENGFYFLVAGHEGAFNSVVETRWVEAGE